MRPDESAIDRELRTALDVAPSPDFTARVRMRIASEPQPSPWWAWSRTAVTVAAMAAVLVAAVVVLRPHQQTPSRFDVSLPGAGAPAAAPDVHPALAATRDARPVVEGPAVARLATANPAVPRSVARTRREPEVLVSPAEKRGLRRLIVLANQGDPGLESLLSQPPDPTIPDIMPDEIVIAPITIEPLASDTQ